MPRYSIVQVPIARGLDILRNRATTESGVSFPVRGFSRLGTFSISRARRTASPSTSMRCMLRLTAGSAQISIVVRSGPMPAIASAAATLTLAGKPRAASRAVPEKTRRAPASPLGGLRVIMWTRSISPTAAACTASRPSSAPVGTRMRPPWSRARSTRSKLSSSAPQDSTTTVRPCSSAGSASSRNTAAGAHSTTMSACCHSSPSGTTGTFRAKPAIAASARARSRADTAASAAPSMPRSRWPATTLPIAPNPAIATRLSMPRLPSRRILSTISAGRAGARPGLAGIVLGGVGIGADEVGVVVPVIGGGGAQHQQLGRLQFDPALGERVLDALVLADRAAEDDALAGIARGAGERGPAQPHRLGGDQDALRVHAVQDVLEPLALLADAVLERHLEPVDEQ